MSDAPRRRIVHLVATPIGAPWMVALASEQKRLGHHVEVIVPQQGPIAEELAMVGIRAHEAPADIIYDGLNPFHKLTALFQLTRTLRRLRPDVVHSHIVNSVITARLASWLADVPFHFAGNVHPLSLESEVLRVLEIGTAFCDTKTIASSSYTRELYAKYGIPEEQLALIFYAVDQSAHDPSTTERERVRHELGIDDATPLIGKIAYFYPPARRGRVVPQHLLGRGIKGHDVLLRAIPRVLAQIPDAKFVLVGRGWGPTGEAYEQELKNLAKSLDIEHATIFPGERNDVADVLAAFDVSVHCSLSDNLAGTVESLLMKNPLIVSNIGGFTDTVLHEQTGLVVPVDDPPALADAIVRLIRDRELARTLGVNGRKHMLANFTLAHTVASTEELLSALPSKNGYRWTTTLARAAMLPFRLLPVVLALLRLRLRRANARSVS